MARTRALLHDLLRNHFHRIKALAHVGHVTGTPVLRPGRQRHHDPLPSRASASRAARRAPIRSGNRTTRPLRNTISITNGGAGSGSITGAGSAGWSTPAISTAAKLPFGPGTIGRPPVAHLCASH